MQRPDASEDPEAHVEGEEHPRLEGWIELSELHLDERERRGARRDDSLPGRDSGLYGWPRNAGCIWSRDTC